MGGDMTTRYRSSLYLETKALVHSGWEHLYGRSPVCEYECTLSFSTLLKAFWHTWQGKFFLGFPSALLRLPVAGVSLAFSRTCGRGSWGPVAMAP